MMFIVFDLDGTLALNEHRQHFVDRPVGEKDWKSFFAACDKDEPCRPLVALAYGLYYGGMDVVEIWSGRSAEVNDKTAAWLDRYALAAVPRRMRAEGDHRPDTVLKEEWLLESIAAGRAPDLVFDDRASVVKMWREHGIVCAQVAPGEF